MSVESSHVLNNGLHWIGIKLKKQGVEQNLLNEDKNWNSERVGEKVVFLSLLNSITETSYFGIKTKFRQFTRCNFECWFECNVAVTLPSAYEWASIHLQQSIWIRTEEISLSLCYVSYNATNLPPVCKFVLFRFCYDD